MLDDEIARRLLHLVVGAEAKVIVLPLRRGVHPPALIPAERPLLVVVGHDVLPQLGTDRLEPVPEVTENGKIAKDGVLALRHVVQHQHHDGGGEYDPDPHSGTL